MVSIRASIVGYCDELIILTANQIKNGCSRQWERRRRRQKVEQLEGQ